VKPFEEPSGRSWTSFDGERICIDIVHCDNGKSDSSRTPFLMRNTLGI
jgi:hypothetical protein